MIIDEAVRAMDMAVRGVSSIRDALEAVEYEDDEEADTGSPEQRET